MPNQMREREQHLHWSQLVSDYIDGELAPAESMLVACHLWECRDCRALLCDFLAILAALQHLREDSWVSASELFGALTFSDVSIRRRCIRFPHLAGRLEC